MRRVRSGVEAYHERAWRSRRAARRNAIFAQAAAIAPPPALDLSSKTL